MSKEITIKHYNVNSKLLLIEIEDFVMDGLSTSAMLLNDERYREMICETLSDLLWEYKDSNVVDNFKVVGDQRNNTRKDLDNGIFKLDIYYKQHHCLNTTHLSYKIDDN